MITYPSPHFVIFFYLDFKDSFIDNDNSDGNFRRGNGISMNEKINRSHRQPMQSLSILRKQLNEKKYPKISENGNTNEISITNQTASDVIFQVPLITQSQSTIIIPSSISLNQTILDIKTDHVIFQQQQQSQSQIQIPSLNDKARLNLFSAIKSLRKDSWYRIVTVKKYQFIFHALLINDELFVSL